MNNENSIGETTGTAAPTRPPVVVVVVAIILFAQAALLIVALAYILIETLSRAESIAGAGIAEAVLIALAVAWVVLTAIGQLRLASWSRASVVAIEALHLAVAVGLFQGAFANPAYGFALLLPALTALGLTFTRPAIAATMRKPRPEA